MLPIMSVIILPDFTCALWLKHLRLMRHLFSIKKLFMNIVSLTISFADFSFRLAFTKGAGVGVGEGIMFLEQKGEGQKKMICNFLAFKHFSSRKALTSQVYSQDK